MEIHILNAVFRGGKKLYVPLERSIGKTILGTSYHGMTAMLPTPYFTKTQK